MIHDIMLDKPSGRVAYAINVVRRLSRHWKPISSPSRSALKYDTSLGGYVVALDNRQLEGAPAYPIGTEPDWTDRAYEQKIFTIFTVGPDPAAS